MTDAIAIIAHGTPIPQGSKTGGIVKGRVILRDANAKRLKPWRTLVAKAAVGAMHYHDPATGPVRVICHFTFPRPTSHYRTGRNADLLRDNAPTWPTGHGLGDVDKLLRAVLDALTDADVWGDDAQVVDVRGRKFFAGEHELALDRPGVRIQVEPLDLAPALVGGVNHTTEELDDSASDRNGRPAHDG